MKNVSSKFKNELKKGNRNYIKSADITLKNGTVLHIDNSKLWSNGLKLENAVSNTDSFDISSVIIGQLTLTLLNINDEFSKYDFTDCVASNVKVGLKLEDGTTESLSYGKFYLNETNYSSEVITLTFYDCLYKFDKSYSESKLQYPATLNQIVRDACDVCGVTMGTVTFDNDDYVVQDRPSDESLTFRQVLLWVGQISVHYFYADEEGRLAIGWYDIDGTELNENDTIKSVLRDIDGNIILDVEGNQIVTDIESGLSSFVSLSTHLDDVVITGIRVLQDIETDNGQQTVTYQSGNDGYVLSVSGNKFVQGDQGSYIASMIAAKVVGVRFRGFSATCLSDPTIECGDSIILVDRKGRRYKSIVTNNTFQPGNFQNLSCGAETPARNSATRYSQITQVYVDYRKEIEKEKTDREQALEDLSERVNSSAGVFTTVETLEDGSKKYYLHNKPLLSESDIIWTMTAEAWTVSTDGGKTVNAGMTVDGDTIARILTAVGVNADWIKSGAISIEDEEGNETFFADTETGQVRIVADYFSLKGKSIEEIAKEELEDQIGDLVIGNVNLQRNSDFSNDFSYWVAQSGWTVSTENQFEGVNSAQFSRTGATSNSARDLYSAAQTIPANAGEYYTASAYFYTDNSDGIDANVSFGFWYYDEDNSPVIPTGQTTSLTVSFTNNRWVRHSITAIAPENTAYIAMYVIAYRNGTFYVAKPQLEKGNVVTDWKLAPEDTEDYVDNLIADLKEQIDGKIQTYDQTTDPSTDWNDTEKELHTGDLWYHPDQKTTKRWNGNEWIELQDQEAIDASKLAKTKAQVFYTTPKPPYNVNDLWVQGRTGDIMRCKTARSSGNYVATDWEKASKYTDDSALNDFINGDFKNTIDDLEEQNDKKAETWYQSTDPSTSWTTTELKNEHKGDIWYNTSSSVQKSYRWSGTEWQEMKTTPPPDVFDKIDGKAQIFVSQPIPPYAIGDLWFNSTSSDIMTCVTARTSGSYNASDWQKRNKYTDDSAVTNLDKELNQQGVFDRLTNNGKSQGIFLRDGQLYLNGQYMEFNGAKIGGWTISENQLRCYTNDFKIKIQAPTVYGTNGNGAADVITVRDMVNDSWTFALSSDGTLVLSDEFYYSPQGFTDEPNSLLRVGGWQIKKTYDYLGYAEITYWDTPSSQENGICAHGPWVVWGGWNGEASADVANYRFVVTDQGACKAMSWVTGSRVEWKENIVPYYKNALQEVLNSDVYFYDLKDQSKSVWKEGRHIGFVIGDGYNVSQDILDGGGGAIDMYSALAIAYKAIQEQQEEIEELKSRIGEAI